MEEARDQGLEMAKEAQVDHDVPVCPREWEELAQHLQLDQAQEGQCLLLEADQEQNPLEADQDQYPLEADQDQCPLEADQDQCPLAADQEQNLLAVDLDQDRPPRHPLEPPSPTLAEPHKTSHLAWSSLGARKLITRGLPR